MSLWAKCGPIRIYPYYMIMFFFGKSNFLIGNVTCKCFRTSIQEILSKDFFLCGWMHNKLLLHTYVCQGSASKKICMYVAQSTLNHFILHYFEFLNHVCLLHIVYKFTSDDSCGSYSEIQPHLKIGIIKCISTLSTSHCGSFQIKKVQKYCIQPTQIIKII